VIWNAGSLLYPMVILLLNSILAQNISMYLSYVLFFVLSLKSPFHSTGTRIQSSEMAQPVSQIPLLIQKIKLKLKLMSDKYHLI